MYRQKYVLMQQVLIFMVTVEEPEMQGLYISYKKVVAIVLAPKRWSHFSLWKNKLVVVHSDNMTAVSIINKGTTKNSAVMYHLRELSPVYTTVFNLS